MTTPTAPLTSGPLTSGRATGPLGVAANGYAFMGKAHSNAWRNVASYFDVPAFEQNDPEHAYMDAWWPQGHAIGWEHTFTHQIRDFLVATDGGTPPSPSFDEGLRVQRILHAVEESASNRSTCTAVNH